MEVSRRHTEVNYIKKLLNKTVQLFFPIGINFLKYKNLRKYFFRNIDPSDSQQYYEIYSSNKINLTIGFRNFYCGVNTYIPTGLKNCWSSDHHIMAISITYPQNRFDIIPFQNKIYSLGFERLGIYPTTSITDLKMFLSCHYIMDKSEVMKWLDLFYFNNGMNIFYQNGLCFPIIKEIENNFYDEFIRYIKLPTRFNTARIRRILIKELEKNLASLII